MTRRNNRLTNQYANHIAYRHVRCSLCLDPPLQNFHQPVAAEYNQSTVNISCDVCANPPPAHDAYTWMVNDSVILNQVY